MGKTKKSKNQTVFVENKIEEKEDGEEYGVVTKKLGSGRFMVNMNGNEVQGKICGKMRRRRNKRKNWVEVDSIVLCSTREWENRESGKVVVDITYVYDDQEARQLRKQGAVSEQIRRDDSKEEEDETCGFDFEDI